MDGGGSGNPRRRLHERNEGNKSYKKTLEIEPPLVFATNSQATPKPLSKFVYTTPVRSVWFVKWNGPISVEWVDFVTLFAKSVFGRA